VVTHHAPAEAASHVCLLLLGQDGRHPVVRVDRDLERLALQVGLPAPGLADGRWIAPCSTWRTRAAAPSWRTQLSFIDVGNQAAAVAYIDGQPPAFDRAGSVPLHHPEVAMKTFPVLSCIGAALLGVAVVGHASQHEAAERESGKTTAKEVRQEASDVAEAIKDYAADKRGEAADKAKAGLDALDARINALEARIDENWEKMDKAAREQARSTLKSLREQRVEVAEWYGRLKHGTAEAWESTRKGFSDAYDSLQRAWKKADTDYPEKKP
jgi:hypothetical protein